MYEIRKWNEPKGKSDRGRAKDQLFHVGNKLDLANGCSRSRFSHLNTVSTHSPHSPSQTAPSVRDPAARVMRQSGHPLWPGFNWRMFLGKLDLDCLMPR